MSETLQEKQESLIPVGQELIVTVLWESPDGWQPVSRISGTSVHISEPDHTTKKDLLVQGILPSPKAMAELRYKRGHESRAPRKLSNNIIELEGHRFKLDFKTTSRSDT
jgi:hypothetical protein